MFKFLHKLRKGLRSSEPPVDSLEGAALESEKTRSEIRKLQVEVQELRAWRSKLFFSGSLAVLAPFGSIVVFIAGWFGAHAAERIHQSDDLYNRAAKQLSSPEASVRLSAVLTLDHFVRPPITSSVGSLAERLFSSKDSRETVADRPRATMALLVGRLSSEDDPAVLDAIALEVGSNPDDSVTALLSMNRSAAVKFARAAGDYSGLSVLRVHHVRAYSQDDLPGAGASDPSVTDVVAIVLRTGSPFEATAKLNQQFQSRDFLINTHCPFRELFKKQQRLALSSDLSDVARTKLPPSVEIMAARKQLIDTAATLERSSYILGKLATRSWFSLQDQDLYGTAIVVGELDDGFIEKLQSRGAYFSGRMENRTNPGCKILPGTGT